MASKKSFANVINPAERFISIPQEEPREEPRENQKEEPVKAPSTIEVATPPDGYKVNHEYIEKKSRRLQLLTKPSTHETLKAIADSKHMSLNDLINTLLEAYIAQEGK